EGVVTADTDRFEQVLTNSIGDPMRHSKQDGSVYASLGITDNQLLIEVTDNGVGIPEKDLSFIFERSYKAHKSRTRSDTKKGTGLGLAFTKHIVDAHDETISVKTKINEGTTFSVKILQ